MQIESTKCTAAPDDFVWGAFDISKYLGRSKEATWFMLEQGRVPGAKKVAGRWGLHLPTFTSHFAEPRQPVAA